MRADYYAELNKIRRFYSIAQNVIVEYTIQSNWRSFHPVTFSTDKSITSEMKFSMNKFD